MVAPSEFPSGANGAVTRGRPTAIGNIRGELAQMLPVGLVRETGEIIVKDPNIEVQQRIGLVFDSFLRLRSAAKVMRLFQAKQLDLPRQDRHGELRWMPATIASVATILKNGSHGSNS